MPRACKNSPDNFCYICANFTDIKSRRRITPTIQRQYQDVFKIKLGDFEKPWAPSNICVSCSSRLARGKDAFIFNCPASWRIATNCSNDCYFCLSHKTLFGKKTVYPENSSVTRPDFDLCLNLSDKAASPDEEECQMTNEGALSGEDSSEDFIVEEKKMSQVELNDLVRKLALSKEKSQILASRLKRCNALESGVTFHQDIKVYESRYSGVWDVNMVSDFCWNIFVEGQEKSSKRKHV
jgi:hypothetical protein